MAAVEDEPPFRLELLKAHCAQCWSSAEVQLGSNGTFIDTRTMSALGQKRTFSHVRRMSALPPKADIRQGNRDVRFVPKADIRRSLTFAPAHTRSAFVGPHCSRPAYPRHFAQVLRLSPLIGLKTLGNA